MWYKRPFKFLASDGFTLTELLIVVIIIGILAAIALPIFKNAQRSAIDASIKSDVHNTVSETFTWLTDEGNWDVNAQCIQRGTDDAPQCTNMSGTLIAYPKMIVSGDNVIYISFRSYGVNHGFLVGGYNTKYGGKYHDDRNTDFYFYSTTGKYGVGSSNSDDPYM